MDHGPAAPNLTPGFDYVGKSVKNSEDFFQSLVGFSTGPLIWIKLKLPNME